MATNMLSKKGSQPTDEDRKPGVVYIGHVPHGFYEKQLREYFSQFGSVLKVKLSRSKKSGKSKGYAFIKFRYAAVAKTVAETCHNYLFFNKLLKCEYKPLSEVHEDTFRTYRLKPNYLTKRQHNTAKKEKTLVESAKKSARQSQRKLDKLKEMGIDLKLEDVMNVPECVKTKPKPKTATAAKILDDVDAVTSPASRSARVLAGTIKTASAEPSSLTSPVSVSSVVPAKILKRTSKGPAVPAKILKRTSKGPAATKGRKAKPPQSKKARVK